MDGVRGAAEGDVYERKMMALSACHLELPEREVSSLRSDVDHVQARRFGG